MCAFYQCIESLSLYPYLFLNSGSLSNFCSSSCSVNETLPSSLFFPQFRHSPYLPSPLTVAPDHQRCFRKIHRALDSRKSCCLKEGFLGMDTAKRGYWY